METRQHAPLLYDNLLVIPDCIEKSAQERIDYEYTSVAVQESISKYAVYREGRFHHPSGESYHSGPRSLRSFVMNPDDSEDDDEYDRRFSLGSESTTEELSSMTGTSRGVFCEVCVI